MCSICGGNYPLEVIQKVSKSMRHRGQDFSGDFSDEAIALAHNRLSIIDLEANANQPFSSPFCPHLVLVFNGEIYNYLEIKAELETLGVPFYTQSDTEVLLCAFAYFGTECLKKFNGDFAFVIYDKRDKSLFLARDRLGNKPLFYRLSQGKICFASEIKAFLEIFPCELDLEEVSSWLLFSNGDLQKSIYKGIFPFPPAHFAIFSKGEMKFERYWDFAPKEEQNLESPKQIQNALEELESLLKDSVRIRLRSDVPVALSISGGIDSSILAHFVRQCGVDCLFFGVNFKESNQDETPYIKQLQKDLDCRVQYIAPTLSLIKEDFKPLVFVQDEIFRSFSIYSQFLLFKSIAPFCKVALGGQGADELFGGYYHHIGRYLFERYISGDKNTLEERLWRYGKEAFGEYQFGLKCSLGEDLKLKLFTQDNLQELEKLTQMKLPIPSMKRLLGRFVSDFTQGLWLDTTYFNLPNLLRYEDRNAMAFGIENRTPWTDFRIVEFAFRIPRALKFQKGYSKYLLRLLLEKLGSKKLAWRIDKVGFSAPEVLLMQKLGYNFTSLFDIRVAILNVLRERL